jgi:hypothetical protein
MTHPRRYLTLVTAPPGMNRDALAEAVAAAGAFDRASIRLSLGRAAPCILGLFDEAACRAAAGAIIARGGDAFTCSIADLERLGPARKARDLRVEEGRVAIGIWRGGEARLEPGEIQILIRARLSEKSLKPSPMPSPFLGSAPMLAYGIGGSFGIAAALHTEFDPVDVDRGMTIRTSDKLDIHTARGTIYQIDGDKFAYQVLGDLRGHSDNENMDRMCDLFIHLAPHAVIDPYFSLWRPPPGHRRLRLPGDRAHSKSGAAFAFYSRWAATVYRHVMGVS